MLVYKLEWILSICVIYSVLRKTISKSQSTKVRENDSTHSDTGTVTRYTSSRQ